MEVPSQTGNLSLDFSADLRGAYCFRVYDSLGTLKQQECIVNPSAQSQGNKSTMLIGHIPLNGSQFVTFQPQNLGFPPKTIRILQSKDECHLGDAGTLRKIGVKFSENIFELTCTVFQKSVVQHREDSSGLRVLGELQPVSISLICSHGNAELTATTTQVETYSLGCFHPESTVLGAVAVQDDGDEPVQTTPLRNANVRLGFGSNTGSTRRELRYSPEAVKENPY